MTDSKFPLLIKLSSTHKVMCIFTPEDIPQGEVFTVLMTNFDPSTLNTSAVVIGGRNSLPPSRTGNTFRYPENSEGYFVEVEDRPKIFRFRISNIRLGRYSPWGMYKDVVQLDTYFAVTEYRAGKDTDAYNPLTFDQVAPLIGIVR